MSSLYLLVKIEDIWSYTIDGVWSGLKNISEVNE